jgi:hypothetical protein
MWYIPDTRSFFTYHLELIHNSVYFTLVNLLFTHFFLIVALVILIPDHHLIFYAITVGNAAATVRTKVTGTGQ